MKRSRLRLILSSAVFLMVCMSLIKGFVLGFRLPSEYVMSQNMFTYKFGFIPRGLIGSLLSISGDAFYSYQFQKVVIISVCIAFFIWMGWNAYQFIFLYPINIAGILIITAFGYTVWSAYYSFESGYFEQYGFLLMAIYIEILSIHSKDFESRISKSKNGYIIISAILMFITLLISETNAFLVCPILFSCTISKMLLDYGKDIKIFFKKLSLAIILWIPSGLYCLIINFIRMSEERVLKIINDVRLHTSNFTVVEPLGEVMYGPRSPEKYNPSFVSFTFYWPKTETIIFILLIIILVSTFLILNGEIRMALNYIVMSIFITLCSYATTLVAWDYDRYFAMMGITVIIFSIFYLRVIGKNSLSKKKRVFFLLCSLVFILSIWQIKDFRYWLMDNGTYNETWEQFTDKW